MVRRQLLVAIAVFVTFAVVGHLLLGPVAVEALSGDPAVTPDCRVQGGGFLSDDALGYFTNNAGVAFVLMGGMGVLTVGALAYNGILLGAGWALATSLGASNTVFVACVLPHSLLELPALWLAGAIGLFLPWRALLSLSGRRENVVDPTEEVNVVQLIAVVLLLLLVAGFLEAELSGRVARLLLGPP